MRQNFYFKYSAGFQYDLWLWGLRILSFFLIEFIIDSSKLKIKTHPYFPSHTELFFFFFFPTLFTKEAPDASAWCRMSLYKKCLINLSFQGDKSCFECLYDKTCYSRISCPFPSYHFFFQVTPKQRSSVKPFSWSIVYTAQLRSFSLGTVTQDIPNPLSDPFWSLFSVPL